MDREPYIDRAVCDACWWEGWETDILVRSGDGTIPDKCPKCGQFAINYFIQPSIN